MKTALWLLPLLALEAVAQEYRGTVTGLVGDPSSAMVVAASVSLINNATGVEYHTKTNDSGLYIISLVPPGEYTLKVDAMGFKGFSRSPIVVEVQSRVQVNVTLELGAVGERITVQSESPLLEMASASTGQVIENRRIVELPLNGRNPLALAQISPGVISIDGPSFLRAFDVNGASSLSIGGGLSATGGAVTRSNDFTLDGAPNTTRGNTVAYVPPVDAVQEFKVETAPYDASSGHTSGGVMNISTKSGTNDLHGSIYYFHRDAGTSANTWFNDRAGRSKTASPFHQWGFSSGGPVEIPKLYDGRNRTFWFTAYEGIWDATPTPFLGTVPTEAERQGDFSALLQSGIQIYDPFSTRPDPSRPGRFLRTPLANNIVPSDKINTVAKNLLQYVPLPNLPTTDPQGRNNFFNGASTDADHFASWISRFDHSFTDRNRISGRLSWNHRTEVNGDTFNTLATGSLTERINRSAVLDDTITVTPTLLLNARFAWTRFEEPSIRAKSVGFDISSLGFSNTFTSQVAVPHIPGISFSGFSGFGGRAARITNTDLPAAAFTANKISGRHSVKTGIDFRVYRETGVDLGRPSGQFNFTSDWTKGPSDNSVASPIGQDFAGFLYGLPSSGTSDFNASRAAQAIYTGLFIQDDWRISKTLTLNLGLRYEYEGPVTERYNRMVRGFDVSATNPVSTPAFPVLGGLEFAGNDNRGLWKPDKNDWAPRFGLAWQLTQKTVFRAGYGIYYQPLITDSIIQPGFSTTTQMVATTDFGQTYIANLTNPFPKGLDLPVGAAAGLATFNGQAVSFIDTGRVHPRAQRWSVGLQRQLPAQMLLDIGYTGNHTSNMDVDHNINFVPRSFLSTSPVRDQAAIDYLTQAVPNPLSGRLPGSGLNGATVARQQLLLPFPEFTTVTDQRQSLGSSDFHALGVKVEKRFSKGLNFLATYTFSKLTEDRSLLNDSDTMLEHRLAAEDRPQRFVLSGLWELPLLRHSRFGGWQIQGVYTAQSGTLLNWGNALYYGGPVGLDNPSVDLWFNTSAFERTASRQLASNIRTFPSRISNVRSDGINNFDIGILKNTKITERITFQVRAEAFNALNHPAFSGASTDPTSSNFGKVTNQLNLPRQIQFGGRILF